MKENYEHILDHYNQFTKRITYYTSLFLGSLGVFMASLFFNVDISIEDTTKIIFIIYLLSLLSMIVIGNIIWKKIDDIALKLSTLFKSITTDYALLSTESEILWKLIRLEEQAKGLGENISSWQKSIVQQKKKIEAIEESIEILNKSHTPSLDRKWYKFFDMNVLITSFSLALGILNEVIDFGYIWDSLSHFMIQ